MYKLGFVVITRNRCNALINYIEQLDRLIDDISFCISVIDGSDERCESKIKQYDNVYYYYVPELSFVERTIYGVNCCDAEYICITGDTKVVDVNKFANIISYFYKDYDLIEFSNRDKKNINEKKYTSIEEFFADNSWDCTMFGTVFFRKEAYEIVDERNFKLKYNDNPFPHIIYYFNYFKNRNFCGFFKAYSIFKGGIAKENDNWPNKLETFGKRWIECVDYLKDNYDIYKDDAIKDHGIYSSLMIGSETGFYKLRMKSVLSREIVDLYADIIPKLTNVSISRIIHISKMPKACAKIMYYSKRFIEKCEGWKNENEEFFDK